MGDKKIICIMLFVLLLGFIPLTVAAEKQTSHPVIPAGYGEETHLRYHPKNLWR